jgi:hypothetical protein
MVIELKAIMFKSLYVLMAAYNCSRFSNFLEFFVFCFLIWCFSCTHPVYLVCEYFFMRLDYLYEKKIL